MRKPEVSVVMATFNESPAIISGSIQSILDQTYEDFELLILDDSTDHDTVRTIDRFAALDARVKVIRAKQRMGFVNALNIGLRQACGKYIARMDGDDLAVPRRFEWQVAHLESHQDVHVLGGAMDIINESNEVTAHRNYPYGSRNLRFFTLFRSPLAHPTVMINRSVIDDGFCYNESFKKAEDIELWLRLLKHGYRISNLQQTILQYRIVGNLSEKRDGDQFRYNYKARRTNFSWKTPLWSMTSVCISGLYRLIPKSLIAAMYQVENKSG